MDKAIAHDDCAARVLAVADAIVAMTTDRPYRAARSIGDAIAEIRKFDGCQFEHAAVEAAAEVSEGRWAA